MSRGERKNGFLGWVVGCHQPPEQSGGGKMSRPKGGTKIKFLIPQPSDGRPTTPRRARTQTADGGKTLQKKQDFKAKSEGWSGFFRQPP